MRLAGTLAVVTGAGSGIGRALAGALHAAGCRLALLDLDADGLAATVARIDGDSGRDAGGDAGRDRPWSATLDVADRDAVFAAADRILAACGPVDLVVNNAGIAHGGVGVADLRPADLHRVMDVNFFGVVHGTQAFLPHLVARPEAAVVNVSSLFGLVGAARQSAYCASKFAVRGFTESLRMELRATAPHVRAVSVHPGGVATAIARNSIPAGPEDDPADRAAFEALLRTTPEAAARTIVAGIARGRERILVGSDARAGDRIARLLPVRYTDVLLARFARAGLSARRTPVSTWP